MKWLLGLSIAAASAESRAEERAVMVEVAADAPFAAPELAAALQIRVPATGAPIRVRVVAIPGGVRIEARGGAREIALRGATGPAAARLVALAATDLVVDEVVATPPPAPELAPARSATLGALGGVAAWQYAIASLGVDLAAARGAWLVALDAGGGTLIGGPLHLTAGVIRCSAGARFGDLELRAGATIVPVVVGDGVGDATVLAGGGASARLHVPIDGRLHAVLAGGADVFATRTTYVVDGMPALTTPRSALWFAAGLELAP